MVDTKEIRYQVERAVTEIGRYAHDSETAARSYSIRMCNLAELHLLPLCDDIDRLRAALGKYANSENWDVDREYYGNYEDEFWEWDVYSGQEDGEQPYSAAQAALSEQSPLPPDITHRKLFAESGWIDG